MDDRPILWKPNPWPQTFVLSRVEKEILYWGSRWWGKTDAGIAWLMRWIEEPKLRVLVLRETYDDLVDWIDRAMALYSNFGAVKSGIPVQIVFPSWATIRTGYLKWQSYDKYKGHEYQKMIIEEVTQIPWEEHYEKLLGSLRSTVKWLQPQIFLTTNPDGVGRLWVKRRFVDVAIPNERYIDAEGNTRIFVPARLTDNPVLMEKDPWYVKYLQGIKDDQLRKAWLDWDWEAYDVKGAIYSSQLKQARNESRICRLPIEPDLMKYAAWDMGMNDDMSIIVFQVFAKEIRIVDTYSNNWEPIAFYIKQLHGMWHKIDTHFLPHDANVRSRQTGKTDFQVMSDMWEKCIVLPRTPAIWTDIGKVRQFFAYCWFDSDKTRTLLEHLEIYRKEWDEKHQVFKDAPFHWPESHSADAFRYVITAYTNFLNTRTGYTKPEDEPIAKWVMPSVEQRIKSSGHKNKMSWQISKTWVYKWR